MGLLRSRKELRALFHVVELYISPAVRPLEFRWGQPGHGADGAVVVAAVVEDPGHLGAPLAGGSEIFADRACHQRQRKVSSFLELGRGPGGMSAQPSNFSGKRVIILPGDRSRYGQHTHTLRRASIARGKRAFIMEM